MPDYLLEGFNKKFIFCGDYLILKEYSLPYLNDVTKHDNIFHDFKDNDASSPKRLDNLKRARDTVAQYVYTNLTPHTKFLTLTTAETVLDVPVFQRKLQTFFQAMKRNGFDLDYIYVYERQKERGKKEGNLGSLHAHIIVFNDEYIPFTVINKCWKHGSIDIKILDGLRCNNNKKTNELIKNPASYICKYITKESVAEWNEKVFRTSKGLKKPIVINNKVYVASNTGATSSDSQRLYDLFRCSYTPFYENSKVVRLSSEFHSLDRFLKTTVSVRKVL